MSLMATMKTLRLRRNVMKLAIYRHFANIVVFMVVGKFYIMQYIIDIHNNYSASVIFILWDIQTHRTGACIEVSAHLIINSRKYSIL